MTDVIQTLDEKFSAKLALWMEEMFTRYANTYEAGHETGRQIVELEQMKSPYQHYFRRFPLTEEMKTDFAKAIACEFLDRVDPSSVYSNMISDTAVLADGEKSAFWLFPIAYANRTSIAYERGVALHEVGNNELALSVLQSAAAEGDVHCKRYLAELADTGARKKRSGKKSAESLPLPSLTSSLATAKACIAWKEYPRAEKILQKAADAGDIECAMFLIRQKLLHRASGMKRWSWSAQTETEHFVF